MNGHKQNYEKERCIAVVRIVSFVLMTYVIGGKMVQSIPHWLDNYEATWRKQFSSENLINLSYSDMVEQVGKPAHTQFLSRNQVGYIFYPYSKLGPMWGGMVKLRGYPTAFVLFENDRCIMIVE